MLILGFESAVGIMQFIHNFDALAVTDDLFSHLSYKVDSGADVNVSQALHRAIVVLRKQVGIKDVRG